MAFQVFYSVMKGYHQFPRLRYQSHTTQDALGDSIPPSRATRPFASLNTRHCAFPSFHFPIHNVVPPSLTEFTQSVSWIGNLDERGFWVPLSWTFL